MSVAASISAILISTPLSAAQTCDTTRYPPSTTAERFQRIDDGTSDDGTSDDGTVIDKRSKLMWMRCSAGQTWSGRRCSGAPTAVTYEAAQAIATDVNQAGSAFWKDWRLPRLPEIAAIAERQCDDPRIDLTVFPDTPAAFYWSSTARSPTSDAFVFALSFGPEGLRYVDKAERHHVRLVRNAR